MCTTAFHSGIVCHVPDSFPEIFRRKTSRKLKKTKKTIFQRYWKAEKCKTKKTSRKPTKKNNIPEVLWRGGQTRVSKYCFFVFFGFLEVFLVLHFSAFQDLRKIVFFLIFFLGFLEVFVLFPRGPPQRFSKCHS